MSSIQDYGEFETAWCPGCGNHSILKALKTALAESDLDPHQVLMVSGIGQAAKTPHYLSCNVFNGLHGRALPAAIGAKLTNPKLHVFVESGDGCSYGEGGNHFLAALRRNPDITMLVHDNQIYGLTKGQASPTTQQGQKTKAQPDGVPADSFNPVAVAVTMHGGFVARGFAGMADHLTDLIRQAHAFPGFALVDILQPCVTYNKVNTFSWYKERVYEIPADHDPTDWVQAMTLAQEFGDRIPIGVIYRNENRPTFESRFPILQEGPLYGRIPDHAKLEKRMDGYC
ncbi:2-oxoglutarate ferredoxin oxidoreductase subunit beta [Desulfonatronum thiosulfatophilum]|uniref:2-oxoglutarate ferredoxin oxidoreductase subunit beta n=1 Tax=Desulfonatronum thiosulfatophilum TaxID=617002 RepID=A0A1G6BKM1_9BACT|nr:thiamine pyrophosphate-dependent enzyme [Desulfonatronum thiosulfatophilum]SDB21163.1 2-oxoglutarate ferredoxin oxidoreductase subunit beta [Desulfonatronum thiosulfatophilum]